MPAKTKTSTKTSTAARRAPARKKNAAKAPKVVAPVVFPAQPINLPKFQPGRDYQVANPRTINGRLYNTGEILDQTGLDERHVELLRSQRIIIDIPLGGEPALPIPNVEREPAPISPEERQAMREGDAVEGVAAGKVFPKYKGFGQWFVVDSAGKKVSRAFEGNWPKNDAQKEANHMNREAGIEVTEEEEMIASRQDQDADEVAA